MEDLHLLHVGSFRRGLCAAQSMYNLRSALRGTQVVMDRRKMLFYDVRVARILKHAPRTDRIMCRVLCRSVAACACRVDTRVPPHLRDPVVAGCALRQEA